MDQPPDEFVDDFPDENAQLANEVGYVPSRGIKDVPWRDCAVSSALLRCTIASASALRCRDAGWDYERGLDDFESPETVVADLKATLHDLSSARRVERL
jgi:hypothetical protein